MSYVRRNVVDGVTIFNKTLYDNVQDGVDELFIKSDKNKQDIESSNNEIAVLQEGVADCNNQIKTVENIAKGKNRAIVFSTTEKMAEWLSNEDNKSLCNVGDNLYIVDVGVPDWWISKVLSERNPETGYFYEIAQLETQKVDLSTIEAEIAELENEVGSLGKSVSDGKTLVANAITEKGITTATDASFQTMADNISKIVLGSGNATIADVLSGKTFTNDDGVQYTGTMANQGAKTATLNPGGSYTIPAGYHNGSGKVTANNVTINGSPAYQLSLYNSSEPAIKSFYPNIAGTYLVHATVCGTHSDGSTANIYNLAINNNLVGQIRVIYKGIGLEGQAVPGCCDIIAIVNLNASDLVSITTYRCSGAIYFYKLN